MGLDTLDETKPYDTDPVSLGDDEIRLTRAATKQSFGLEHFLSGEHKFIIGSSDIRPPAGKAGRLFVNTSNNVIEYDNGTAWVQTGATLVPGSVGTDTISNGAITNLKLGPNSVTSDKILNGTILGEDIAGGTISADKLAPGLISGGYLAPGSVDGSKLAANAVTTDKILDGTITKNDIGLAGTIWGNANNDNYSAFNVTQAETIISEITWTSRAGIGIALAHVSGTMIGNMGESFDLATRLRGGGNPGALDGTLVDYALCRMSLTVSGGGSTFVGVTVPWSQTMIGVYGLMGGRLKLSVVRSGFLATGSGCQVLTRKLTTVEFA
jgi:hypothetical protein